MILILTYHKVLAGGEEQGEFYSITSEQFETQIELLVQHQFLIVSPSKLLETATHSPRTCVLSFDDGTVDHFDVVKRVLEKRNCHGLFFVPTAKMNQPGRLSSEQIRQLSDAGHAIASHSNEHIRLDRLPEEDIRVQLEVAQERLKMIIGQPPDFFAPPGGFLSPTIRNLAAEVGLRAIRTMHWGYNHHPDLMSLECVPVNRFLRNHQFADILEGRRMQFAYRAKQITKSLLPARVYEPLRSFVFGMRGRS